MIIVVVSSGNVFTFGYASKIVYVFMTMMMLMIVLVDVMVVRCTAVLLAFLEEPLWDHDLFPSYLSMQVFSLYRLVVIFFLFLRVCLSCHSEALHRRRYH